MAVDLRTDGYFRSAGMVAVPPPSPSDTNPPLGPAILARAAARRGHTLSVVDLNIAYVNRFRDKVRRRRTQALGDHGKDRPLVAAAADHLFASFGLADDTPVFLPVGEEPVQGMHYSFETLDRRLKQAASGGELAEWIEDSLFKRPDWPPRLFGVSLMGPSQVFVGLLALELVKRRYPRVRTAVGGSHVTLLADLIRSDERYRRNVDVVLPGHCEDAFAALLGNPDGEAEPSARVPGRTQRRTGARDAPSFEYTPLFDRDQLGLYPQDRLTLPVQFTRGCLYGRCTFCTYPLVEPQTTDLFEESAADALMEMVQTYGVRRFSLKDSLVTSAMMERLATVLVARGRPVEWSATTKVNRRLTQLAPLLADSGLRTVEIGVETISPRGQRVIDKRAGRADIEAAVYALAAQGILVVVNLIFGLPGETVEEAEYQLGWLRELQEFTGGLVDCSLNVLQIVRGSPMASELRGPVLSGIAPWAFSYAWERPEWVTDFAKRLGLLELARPFATASEGNGHGSTGA